MTTIEVDQTVHGYRAGHQLLRSSRQLSSNALRTMLVESDLSGPTLIGGFDEYLTGYPLEELGTYVLARTWYAPEMDRPGCVWTHSLLIDFADLARVTAIEPLLRLFRRPTASDVQAPAMPRETVNVADPKMAAESYDEVEIPLLLALYGFPVQPVITVTSSARELEDTVLRIWLEQWPRLRRSFRFCTGALSARTQGSSRFDLLVAPSSLAGRLRREASDAIFADDAPSPPPTALMTFDELTRTVLRQRREFSSFTWSYGADVALPRRAWRGLALAFALTAGARAGSATAEDVIGQLAVSFPSRNDAARLKADLLGADKSSKFGEAAILGALAMLGGKSDAFDGGQLEVLGRAKRLWHEDRGGASVLLRRLVGTELDVLGQQILGSLCEGVGPTIAVEIDKLQPGLLPVLIGRSPQLAASSEIWKVSLERQRELLDALARSGSNAVRQALPAMIASCASELADDIARRLGDETVDAVLDALDGGEELTDRVLTSGWTAVLASEPARVAAWVRRGPPTPKRLLVSVAVLDPRSDVARTAADGFWLELAAEGRSALSGAARVRTSTFLLSMAFASRMPDATPLVVQTYDDVYRAARDSRLPYDAWRWLDSLLPSLGWWRSWDRCERLALGLADYFGSGGADHLQAMADAARDPHAFAQVVDVSRRGRSDLLQRLRDAAGSGLIRLSPEQASALGERPLF